MSPAESVEINLPVASQANHALSGLEPGKKKDAIIPEEALLWIKELHKGGKKVTKINISGPGDPLATPETTFRTLELIGPESDNAEITVTTLGLGAARYAPELAALGVDQVVVNVDAVMPETMEKIYSWIRPGKRTIPLSEAAARLSVDQDDTVRSMSRAGIKVLVHSNLYKDINEAELVKVAEKMGEAGALSMEISHVSGSTEIPGDIVSAASAYIPVTCCTGDKSVQPPGRPEDICEYAIPSPVPGRPNVAVVSSNGMDIDMHLGQATSLLIYGPREDGLPCMLEVRRTPPAGTGAERWQRLADECLKDCFALLASHAGDAPRKILAEQGVKVITTEDNIDGVVDVLFGGGKKKKCK